SFDVDDGGLGVLRLVPQRVNDDAAGNRAVGTDASRLGRTRDLELAHLRLGLRDVEAQGDGPADGGGLEESATREFHQVLLRGRRRASWPYSRTSPASCQAELTCLEERAPFVRKLIRRPIEPRDAD